MSRSQVLRQEGNEILRSVTEGLAPVLWESRMNQVIGKYHNAIQAASDEDELSSAAKNCAVATAKVATRYFETSGVGQNSQKYKYYIKETLKYLSVASDKGLKCKPLEWQTDVNNRLRDVIDQVYSYAREHEEGKERIAILQLILDSSTEDEIRGNCFYEIGSVYFREAVRALATGDHKRALAALADANRPVEEVKKVSRVLDDLELASEAEVLEQDVALQRCTAESIQARVTGDNLIETALSDYEDLPVPLIWDAIDWYTKARLLCREIEIEQEAIAYSRLGRTYVKVLKIKYLAKECFNRALELADSMEPKDFSQEDWYKEVQYLLGALLKDDILAQEKVQSEKKTKIIESLKKELDELDNKSAKDLLNFIYKEHPPKAKSGHGLKPDFTTSMKKTLATAILHFHPDKIDEDTYGLRWKVLCEEITKRLTNHFNRIKAPMDD